jgi:hypothetical protein
MNEKNATCPARDRSVIILENERGKCTIGKYDVRNRKERLPENEWVSRIMVWPKTVRVHSGSWLFDSNGYHSDDDRSTNTKESLKTSVQ